VRGKLTSPESRFDVELRTGMFFRVDKLVVIPNFKNPPDGYFRLKIPAKNKKDEFLAKNQGALKSIDHQGDSRPQHKVAPYSEE